MSAAPIRLATLAAELGREVEGDGEVEIGGVAALESAGPGDLAYVRSPRFARALADSKAAALIAPPGLDTGGRPVIRSPHPGLDFARAMRRLLPAPAPQPGAHPAARVADGASIDASASIGPGAVIGTGCAIGPRSVIHANVSVYAGVTIGADCVIHAGSVLREGTVLGDRVILQPGVVLGGDGFGYALDADGHLEAVPQIGRVIVEDDVEIGANATIDRGTLGDTRIARGAKIDNLVQVGHNCVVGENAVVIAQAGIAGSTRLGPGALVLAQAGVADHLEGGERACVGPQSGVHTDVPARTRVMGTPPHEVGMTRRIWAALAHLPGVLRRLRAVERRLGLRDGRDGADGS